MNEQATLNTQVLDALLLDYATGALSRPLEILVETHLAMNEASSQSMRMLMQLGGILLEDCEPVSLSEGALEKVMSQLGHHDTNTNGAGAKIHSRSEWLPHPIANYVPQQIAREAGGAPVSGSWKPILISVIQAVRRKSTVSRQAQRFPFTPIQGPKSRWFCPAALQMRPAAMALVIFPFRKPAASISPWLMMMANALSMPSMKARSG